MDNIRLGFVGDIFPGGVLTFKGGISSEVKEILAGYDLRIANLESALCDLGTECKVKMGDPNLGNLVFSPEKSIEILKQLNINIVSLANNHIFDCDYDGLIRTIELLDKNNIAHFGAGRNEEEARKPAVVNIKGKTICFLGYFPPEWEAPYTPHGEIGGLNQFIIENIIADIEKYKRLYDYVFVIPHWGKEHTLYPLISNVIDLSKILKVKPTGVLGSHSHLPQTSFVKDNIAVAMSMGNFIFPDRYIVSPRKTYYPTELEINSKNIPVTYDFPFVDKMTLVKMHKGGRIGLICGIILEDNKVTLERKYTLLDSENYLISYQMPFSNRIKMNLIKLFVLHPLIYRIYAKVCNIILSKFIRTTYRIGTFNATN